MLVNVERRVCRSEHLGPAAMRLSLLPPSILTPNSLVDVVYADSLQDLSLHNVSNARLGHDLTRRRGQPQLRPRRNDAGEGELTGIETASMISLIILGSDMRATPPSRLMSEGTRSRACGAKA